MASSAPWGRGLASPARASLPRCLGVLGYLPQPLVHASACRCEPLLWVLVRRTIGRSLSGPRSSSAAMTCRARRAGQRASRSTRSSAFRSRRTAQSHRIVHQHIAQYVSPPFLCSLLSSLLRLLFSVRPPSVVPELPVQYVYVSIYIYVWYTIVCSTDLYVWHCTLHRIAYDSVGVQSVLSSTAGRPKLQTALL